MKAKKSFILFFFLLFSVPFLAQQQWYFSIDEYHPASREQLQGISRILVVNNALQQPAEFGHTTILDGDNQSNVEVQLQSAILHCLFSATQELELCGEFLSVELLDISQNTSTNYYSRQPLTPAAIEKLFADYQADALLTLNQLVIYDVAESFLTNRDTYYAYLQAFAQSHWTIHYRDSRIETVNSRGRDLVRDYSFTQADTLLWESRQYYDRAQTIADLPPRQEALLYMASQLGQRVADSFIPFWQPARRYIYEVEELKLGLEAFRYQRWQQAIDCWQHFANNEVSKSIKTSKTGKDKKTAACAAANIAIAYEMQGDYASACAYAEKASRLFASCKTVYARQQQANMRYYLAQLQAKMAR